MRKVFFFFCLLVFCLFSYRETVASNTVFGVHTAPPICPGNPLYPIQVWGESASTKTTYSKEGILHSHMHSSQKRVNEITQCPNLSQKQSESISQNHNYHQKKVEETLPKVVNKEAIAPRITLHNLQTKKRLQASPDRPAHSNEALLQMRARIASSAQTIASRYIRRKPSSPSNTSTKSEAQIRKENDCYPDETIQDCLYGSDEIPKDGSGRGEWDGKYNSAAEYERAHGIRR